MSFVSSMSCTQLLAFLDVQNLNLSVNTREALIKNEVDGDIFYSYSEEDLVNLGINKGPARKLFTFIEELRNKFFLCQGQLSYFFCVPPLSWSFDNFCTWINACWPSRSSEDNKEDDKRFFYHTIGNMKDSSTTSPVVLDVILNLLKLKKKVSRSFYFFFSLNFFLVFSLVTGLFPGTLTSLVQK